MFLYDNIAVDMNGKNHCKTWWWIIAYTKLVFFILLHLTVFENLILFFIELIFMYEVWKCSKHSGSESLPLLQRSYGVVAVSQKYQNFKNRRRLFFLFELSHTQYMYSKNSYILMNIQVKYGKNLIKTDNYTSVQYCWICKIIE